MRRQEPLIFLRGELAAAIGVQNDWRAARPLPYRHQHRLDHQLAILLGTRGEVPFQMVARPGQRSSRGLIAPAPPLRHAAQPGRAHQAGYPVVSTPLPRALELLPDPRTAADALRLSMELTNPGK